MRVNSEKQIEEAKVNQIHIQYMGTRANHAGNSLEICASCNLVYKYLAVFYELFQDPPPTIMLVFCKFFIIIFLGLYFLNLWIIY